MHHKFTTIINKRPYMAHCFKVVGIILESMETYTRTAGTFLKLCVSNVS